MLWRFIYLLHYKLISILQNLCIFFNSRKYTMILEKSIYMCDYEECSHEDYPASISMAFLNELRLTLVIDIRLWLISEHMMGNIDTEESVFLFTNIIQMFTRWPTITVSHDKCSHSPYGILVYVNILFMFVKPPIHISCNSLSIQEFH